LSLPESITKVLSAACAVMHTAADNTRHMAVIETDSLYMTLLSFKG
jgi:hypothetical protein